MHARIEYSKVNPAAVKAMYGLEAYVKECGLEASLLDLIKTRASQISGCARCIDMHARGPGARKKRTAALSARCLARSPLLHRA